jgi:hypothetical protein
MSYSKKMLSVLLATLLTLSLLTIIPVKADVDISVYTVGDVNLTVEIVDGTLHIIYNGVDLLTGLNSLQNSIHAIAYQISYLATKTELGDLNQTVNQLVGELDIILEDIYSKTIFLAYAIGLNSNSTVGTNLMSGNYTVAGYFESIITEMNNVSSDIATLDNVLSEINLELQAFENYTDGKLNATYLEIENLANYTDKQLNAILFELNEKREKLTESMVKDVLTLDTKIQEEADRQTITEENFEELERRLDAFIAEKNAEDEEIRKLFSVSFIAVLGSALTIGLVYTAKRKNGKALFEDNSWSKFLSLAFIGPGLYLLAFFAWIVYYDITVWDKNISLILLGSRAGEAISLGINMRLIYYLIIGLTLISMGIILFLLPKYRNWLNARVLKIRS